VAVWGIGFNDHRAYTIEECRRLVEFLKDDPEAGGCTVMLACRPIGRELSNDAVGDPKLLALIALADIVSPWTVGRYVDPEGARRYARSYYSPISPGARPAKLNICRWCFRGLAGIT